MLKGSGAALAAFGLLATTGSGEPISVHANHKEITMIQETMIQDTAAHPERPRFRLRSAAPPGRVHPHVHQLLHQNQ